MRAIHTAILLGVVHSLVQVPAPAATKRPTKKAVQRAPAISPKVRAAALDEVKSLQDPSASHFQNAGALQPFFEKLTETERSGLPVHILQYGDSHTASDDWVDAMRKAFQTRFGYGGPGFTLAGHPYKGYRRFDVSGASSPGWITAGTTGHTGDGRNGLGGVSVTASRPRETISLTASGDQLKLYFLRQPGGGSFRVSSNGSVLATVSTNGALGSGVLPIPVTAGENTYTVETTSYAPVRLFGWISENNQGVTWETLGINGAQARTILEWDRDLWKDQLQERDPALVAIAYGTNEALYPLWTAESYRADLLSLIQRFKDAVPNAVLLLVGPPDCSRRGRLFPHLQEVVRIQGEVARKTGSAFWDWQKYMNDSGGRTRWVQAGLSQPDYTHLTADGYRMLGKTIADELLAIYTSLHSSDATR